MIMELQGNKTYIVAGALLLYAIGGFVAGRLDFNTAFVEGAAALTAMGFRSAIAKWE